jgi:peptidyl-prolyl cis-trans isomerase D
MLKQMRSRLKSAGAWLFVALLVPAFALWGVPELRDIVQRPMMRVGDVDISNATLQREYARVFERRRDEAGGRYTPEDARGDRLADQVADQIAVRTLLELEADKLGLAMPDSLVSEFLTTNEAFQNPSTGKFDQLALENILRSNNLSVPEFESIIKKDLLRTQLIASVAAGAPAPAELAEGLLLRETEVRRIGYLAITDDMTEPAETSTEEKLKSFYESRLAEFQSPEFRTLTAVILRPEDFTDAEPPEEELRRAYETNRERLYEQPEKRTLYQLTYDSEEAATAAAAGLRSGKPFEAAARERGLSLAAATYADALKRDILDPKVGEAAFAPDAGVGAVVGPVRGTFGWTVVQIAGVTPPETRSFEEARPEIIAQLAAADSKKKLFDAVEALEEARDTGAILADAAKTAGVEARTFGPVDSYSFAPGGAIVPEVPGEVLKEAFAIAEGEESDARELENGGYFFVQVDDVRPAAPVPFEEIRTEVENKWRAEERRSRLSRAVDAALAAITGGKTLAAVAADLNRAALETSLRRGADDPSLSPELVEKLFAADKGAVVSGADATGGAGVVAEVRDIRFLRGQISAVEETSFRQLLGYQITQEYFEAYVDALREDYGVRADKDRLAALFNETQ